jgi:tRNA A58 N-methylase Trm61
VHGLNRIAETIRLQFPLVSYYANNFQDFKKIVLDFTDTTTKAITDCKDVMQRQELQNNLVFIKANYNFVSKTIEYLEKQQLLLTESIKIIEKFKERILSVPGKIGEIVKKNRKHFQKTKVFLNCRTSVKS